MKARTLLIIALIFMMSALPAMAQEGDGNLPTTLEGLIVSLYNGAVRVVGLAAFLMILYAGVLRLIGRGQESNQVILDAIVGTVLLLSSVVILNSINPDLTHQGQIFRDIDPAQQGAEPEPQAAPGAGGGTNTLPTGGAILPIVIQ